MGDILASIPPSVTVAAYVQHHEARAVYTANGSGAQEAIDLEPYINQGLLRIVELETATEFSNYINFAASLGDDGEAITGAIAADRNWAIGTDDGAATKFFRRHCPQLQIISSLEILKNWAETAQVGIGEIGHALRLVKIRGKYQPSTRHPLYEWWQSNYNA